MHAVAVGPPPEMMPGGVPMLDYGPKESGGRKKGTPNKPKLSKALVSIDRAEAEVRAIKEAGGRVRTLGQGPA